MSSDAIFNERYFTVRRHSIIARAFGIGLVAAGLIVGVLDWLPPPSPGPDACDPAPIDLPHIEIPDVLGQPPGQFVTNVTSPSDLSLMCSDPGPKRSPH
jgi:hypothetical protein